jgi:hypothetical protein
MHSGSAPTSFFLCQVRCTFLSCLLFVFDAFDHAVLDVAYAYQEQATLFLLA